VIIRRTIFDLDKATARVHILEGLKKAVMNINEVIETIKESPNNDIAKVSLIEKFALSEVQTLAILEMKLRRLTGLEQNRIESELEELYKRIDYLRSILKSGQKINSNISR